MLAALLTQKVEDLDDRIFSGNPRRLTPTQRACPHSDTNYSEVNSPRCLSRRQSSGRFT